MAFLISAHFAHQKPSPSKVRAALPSSLDFAIYRHRDFALFAIDTFRAAKPPRHPFSAATPSTDLPLDLPSDLAALSSLYEELRESGTANGLKRAYVNLSCMLSSSLEQEVLSVYGDDGGNDFACLSAKGKVVRMAARCGDELVAFENGRVSRALNESDDHVLHQIVSRHFELFSGHSGSTINLGIFNASENRGFVIEHIGA